MKLKYYVIRPIINFLVETFYKNAFFYSNDFDSFDIDITKNITQYVPENTKQERAFTVACWYAIGTANEKIMEAQKEDSEIDRLKWTLTGITRNGEDVGDFEVTFTKLR